MDIKKLSQVINEIEVTTSDIKKYNEAYKKIVDISQKVEVLFGSIETEKVEMENFKINFLVNLNDTIKNLSNTECKLINTNNKNIKENTELLNSIEKAMQLEISQFHKKLSDNVNNFSNQIEERFNNNNNKLTNINFELQNSMKEISVMMLNDNNEKSMLIKNIENVTFENINNLTLLVNNNTKSNLNLIKNLENIVEERFGEISRDNKNYYKDLDNSIFLRLDKQKSEIFYENFENHKKLEKLLYESVEKINLQNENNKRLINKKLDINTVIIIVLCIANLALIAKTFL